MPQEMGAPEVHLQAEILGLPRFAQVVDPAQHGLFHVA